MTPAETNHMKTNYTLLLLFTLAIGPALIAQDQPTTQPAETADTVENTQAAQDTAADFNQATANISDQLEAATRELAELRELISAEIIPLTRKLGDMEDELRAVRSEAATGERAVASRQLQITNLNKLIADREKEAGYLSGLLGEYIRKYEPLIHIAELQRYDDQLAVAKNAAENPNLTQKEKFTLQIGTIQQSIDRIDEALGGTTFTGEAVQTGGEETTGTFVLVGPTAVFRSDDGAVIGTAEQELGLVPTIRPFLSEEDTATASTLIANGSGSFPFDPTMGSAHQLAAVEDTFLEHVQKGGPVMYPIFIMAGAALLVALYKWLALTFIKNPSKNLITKLCHAVSLRDKDAAMGVARKIGGPSGDMLQAGVEHIEEPRELIEEIMFEKMLNTRLRVNSMLPFISICAAAAPLMGLLGTVTGIINTFKMITLYGTGDAESLSGGISEALITTKFGLIVAIPSLLIYAFLSRKAKAVIDNMEKSGIAFINQVGKTPFKEPEPREPEPTEPDPTDDEQDDKKELNEAA